MKYYEAYKDSGLDWLGEIPEHWDITKLKYLANIFNGTSLKDDLKVQFLSTNLNYKPYIGTKDIDPNTGQIDYNNGLRIPKDEKFAFRLAPKGSFLLCIEGGSAGKKIAFLDESVFFVNKLACFYSSNKYLYYFANSSFFKNQFNINLSGLISGVSINNLKNLIGLNLPSFEQTQIANYLDQKITQIDELIAKKEKLIQLLEEEQTAIINQAVTKGLNPDAPMKDSGIDWLGEIPERWNPTKMKFATEFILDGTHGTHTRVEEGYRLLSVRNIVNGNFVFREDDSKISEEEYLKIASRFKIKENDIQLAIVGATLGKVAVVKNLPENFVTQRSLATIRSKEGKCNHLFLYYFMKSSIFQSYLWLNAGFSAQPGVYLGTLQGCTIPIPSVDEQNIIVKHIQQKESKIDEILHKSKREINFLIEYKTTLISDVVTGKIDVRKEVLN